MTVSRSQSQKARAAQFMELLRVTQHLLNDTSACFTVGWRPREVRYCNHVLKKVPGQYLFCWRTPGHAGRHAPFTRDET